MWFTWVSWRARVLYSYTLSADRKYLWIIFGQNVDIQRLNGMYIMNVHRLKWDCGSEWSCCERKLDLYWFSIKSNFISFKHLFWLNWVNNERKWNGSVNRDGKAFVIPTKMPSFNYFVWLLFMLSLIEI